MSKFKVGDTVKYTGEHDPSYPRMVGRLGVIKSFHWGDPGVVTVLFDEGENLPCSSDNLTLFVRPSGRPVPFHPKPPKFKVGDVVELIPFKDERVITSIDDQFGACLDGGPAHINFDSLKLVRRPNSDPAKPSPIVTETRRFIKSGRYGRVTIDNVSHVAGKLSVGLTGTKMFDAEQLREAAHTLNQIAEVLEENAP